MSIIIGGKTIVGPGNEIYIGENGNFFCGHRDLGIKANGGNKVVTPSEFNMSIDEGLYHVVDNSNPSDPVVELWYISPNGDKFPVNGNNYVVPTIGDNGNWFIGGTDTGKPAIVSRTSIKLNLYTEEWKPLQTTGLFYQNVTCEGLSSGAYIDVSLDINEIDLLSLSQYREKFNKVIEFTVNDGYIRVISTESIDTTIPIIVNRLDTSLFGGMNAGAKIDDNSINNTTVWSSHKISEMIQAIDDKVVQGKDLEFTWEGTNLGVRQSGYTDYRFRDLRGAYGLCGADGSSIVDAELSDNGHLLLTIQDTAAPLETTKFLTLESGVVTMNDLLELKNSISRINNDIAALKTGPILEVYRFTKATSDYVKVFKLTGCGTLQLFVTKFTGSIRIKTDSSIYTGTFTDLSKQLDNNLLVPDVFTNRIETDNGINLLDSSTSINPIIMNPLFSQAQRVPLNFAFDGTIEVFIKIDSNSQKLYPSILAQGQYYTNSQFGEGGGSNPPDDTPTNPPEKEYSPIPDETIDDVLDDVINNGGQGGGVNDGSDDDNAMTDDEIGDIFEDIFENGGEAPDTVEDPSEVGGEGDEAITKEDIDNMFGDVFGSTGSSDGEGDGDEPITDEDIDDMFGDVFG